MATPNEANRTRISASSYLTRIVVCLLGLWAIAWGSLELGPFWQQTSPGSIASEVLGGHTFKIPALLDEALQAEEAEKYSHCNPTALRNLVVLRLAILNESIAAANDMLAGLASRQLYDASRAALSCAPADSFVWLTLFWLGVRKDGLTPGNANYLRLSYALGPNEGWVALPRDRIALALFEQLPPDLSADALDEFVKLVETGRLYWEAAGLFENASPVVQSRIIEHLATAGAIYRQGFARTLHVKGLDVSIPGVERLDARPWR